MPIGNHDEGYEKEVKLKELYQQVRAIQKSIYQWADFMNIARLINPGLCEGAFERRPCVRMLRYIGFDSWSEPTRTEMNAEEHEYFSHGGIYESTDFNGATYSIKGYSDSGKVIGCAYFDWLKDEEVVTDKSSRLLEFALRAAKHMRGMQNNESSDLRADKALHRIAGEYARIGDFQQAIAISREIGSIIWRIRALMETSCGMLKAGQVESALKTIELACDISRDQPDGFPESNLFHYLTTISSFGLDNITRSILKDALFRAEFMEDSSLRLHCYSKMLPCLAAHWQEKAVEVIDHILTLPSEKDEKLHPSPEILIDAAILVCRYNLDRKDILLKRFWNIEFTSTN